MPREEPRVFSALLRHWRTRRGMSQLDLAIAADVSARHISFLETGRAQPSRNMILVIAAALDVPLRDQNVLLQGAGFKEEFAEPTLQDGLPPAIERAIDRMMAQQEPYPMVALNHRYDIVKSNQAAARFLVHMTLEPEAITPPLNMMRVLFDPRLARSFVVEWERTARTLLSRVHRESLSRPSDVELAALVRSVLEYPDVPTSFRLPDFSEPSEPTMAVRLRRGDLELAFLTTVTVFDAPQNVTLDELRLESYFPLDDATARACEALAKDGS